MLRNYLKIAFRNLKKQPLYTLIFISGLAIGLAAFLSLNQYTVFEKSYDVFHDDSENLYRLTTDQYVNGEIQTRDAMSHAPAGPAMLSELPEVVSYSTSYTVEGWVKSALPGATGGYEVIFFAGNTVASDIEIYVQQGTDALMNVVCD